MVTPKIIADFETQLASAIAVGDTSFTLASATDDDGVALPAGKYYFTVENGSSNKEYLVGTVSGTSVTSVSNVSRQGLETSGADRAHRIGSSVIISDFLTYKNYIDETTVAGAADGDTATKGVFEAATLAEVRARTASGSTSANLAVTPDVLDDLPTADEKDALAGTGTPSSSNRYVTEDDASDVVTFTSSGTWTKDAGLKRIRVQVWGAGGSGGRNSGSGYASGGGGGEYKEYWFEAADLGATETVTIGAGGAARTTDAAGANGGTTTFGSLLSCDGGSGGDFDSGEIDGGTGAGAPALAGDTTDRNGYFNAGGAGGDGSSTSGNRVGGNADLAGAGGGGVRGTAGTAGAGGTSEVGGDGGAASDGGNATAGSQPGGGGGASVDGDSGAGGDGQVIVTEYYV